MSVYCRDGRWLVQYKDENNKRRDKSFGRGDKAHQDAIAFNEMSKNAKKSGYVVVNSSQVSQAIPVQIHTMAPKCVEDSVESGLTFYKLSKHYLKHIQISGKSENYIRFIKCLLQEVAYPFFADLIVDDMSYVKDIVPFILHLKETNGSRGKPRSQTTINRYGDYLRAMFNFGIDSGLTKVNPMKGRKKSKEKPRDVQLTIEDMKKIMENADPHVRWAMEVCYSLGTRSGQSELLSLKWENVDFDKRTIKIYATKTKTFRFVEISDSLLKKMKEKVKESKSGYIIEYQGRKVTDIHKGFRAACKRAEIEYDTRMYDLRHLFATTMLSRGADLAAVSKLMGHSTIKMTADVYYHCLNGEKRRAVGLLETI